MNSKIKLILFTIAQALISSFYMFENVWQYSNYITWGPLNTFRNLGFYILVALVITDFIYKPISKKNLIKISIISILILVISAVSKDYKLLFILIPVLAARDLDINKVILWDFVIKGSLLAFELLMFILKAGDSHWIVDRMSLGFDHPNAFGCMLMLAGIELLYLTRKSKNPIPIFVCIFFVIANQLTAKSRSSMIVLSLATLCFLIAKFKLNIFKSKFIQFITRNLFIILLAVSFGLIFLYRGGNVTAIKLDALFSSRINLASHYLDIYGINLFGHYVQNSANTAYVLDNWYYVLDMSFVKFLIAYGVIGTILVAFLYNLTFRKLFKKEKYYLALVLSIYLIYAMMENHAFIYGHNTFLILLTFGLFYDDKKCEYYPNKSLVLSLSVLFICIFIFRETIIENASQFIVSGNSNTYDQIKFLEAFYQRVHDRNFSMYDWSLGLGSSAYNLYLNNFLSPFNLLILPLKKDWIPYVTLYLNIIKLLALSIGSGLWLSKLTSNRNNIISFSLMITFSSLLLNSYGTNYFDFFCLLPFVLFFIEKGIQYNKFIGLPISILLLVLTNPALFIESLVLLLIYAIYRSIEYPSNKQVITIVKLCLIIVLSIGLTSFVALPCLNFIQDSGNNDSLLSLITSLFTSSKTVSDTSTSMYTSVGVLMLLPCLFTLNKKKQILSWIFIAIYIGLSFVFSSNVFIYYMLILFVSSIILTSVDYIDDSKRNCVLIGYITCLCLIIISYVIYRINNDALGYKEFYIELALPILITLIYFAFKKDGLKAISFTIIFEACISMYCLTIVNTTVKDNVSIDFDVANIIKENDSSLYRIIDGDFANTHISASDEYYNIHYNNIDNAKQTAGFSTNTDTYNNEQSEYIKYLNTSDESKYIGIDKNYISLYNIAGAKYWISSSEDFDLYPPSYFENMDINDIDSNLLNFQAHKTSIGWSEIAYNGDTIGQSKDGLQIEAFVANLNNQNYSGDIVYTSYVRGQGWQNDINDESTWKRNGEESGTTDQGLALTGMCINLTGNMANNYDIYYRVNGYEAGWSNWVKNGEKVGFYESDIIEAIQIEIKEKGSLAPNQKYYRNKYFVELGYVNNNLINADYLSTLSSLEREKILRYYVATNNSDNASYSINDGFEYITDYLYERYEDVTLDNPISNTTLVIVNGGIPIVKADLYYDDQLIKSQSFYQYDYCNIELNENEKVNRVILTSQDIDETGYGIALATMKSVSNLEQEVYNQKTQHPFTNITYENDYISGDINISDSNSFVYTYIPYDDNWKVYDNGQEINKVKANYGFTGFILDQGDHRIEFKYEIETKKGNIISIVSFVGIIIFILINKIKK